jgi:hypothetical protein
VIPLDWLEMALTVDEAEERHPGIRDERVLKHPSLAEPFGGQNDKWEALKSQMLPGDEIWTFSAPDHFWQNHAGQAGVALVRAGVPIAVMTTIRN